MGHAAASDEGNARSTNSTEALALAALLVSVGLDDSAPHARLPLDRTASALV